ncbi:carbohydrate sulfotransferase 1-like [Hyalella azteca]|uniref:Carbohydrate sulfotransferase 1-like n=1 Tax=Hyalella azteca TaxID=294128 RepID=A0A8B7NYD5_HYAAZ|nr:carbohydrate sulfotransferase 1-like [Hyalella azteca]
MINKWSHIVLSITMMLIIFLFVFSADWRYIIKSSAVMEPQIGSRSFVTEKLRGDLDFEILIEEDGRTQEKKLTYELLRKVMEYERLQRENIAVDDQETQNYQRKTIVNEGHKFSVKIPSYSGSQELILLVSSLGRGGSSWVGELLSNISEELIYIFEPLKIITDVYESRMTPSMVTEILSIVFSCQFTKAFSEYRKVWPENFRKFPDECKGTHCFDPNILSERCRKAKTIIAKTIRLTLAHVELLMVMPNFQHLKVIYLSRDPRAQVLSRYCRQH